LECGFYWRRVLGLDVFGDLGDLNELVGIGKI